jgi:2-polyprenyl-6-methoxyphenol hydroxylase-like FAD-dependent oxidoreductase
LLVLFQQAHLGTPLSGCATSAKQFLFEDLDRSGSCVILRAGLSKYAKTSDVLVVGGGLSGLVTAAALSELGLEVEVLEAASRPSGSFRGELLHARGVRFLKSFGLESALTDSVEVDGFAAIYGGRPAVRLPYARQGGPGAGFDHHAVVEALRAELKARGRVNFVAPCAVSGVHREGDRIAGVCTPNGEIRRGRLVVAADGRHSRLRRLFGLKDKARLLSYTLVASVPRSALPSERYGHVLLGGPGPVLAYPYSQDRARMCIDVPLSVGGGREQLRNFVLQNYAHVPGVLGAAMARSVNEDPASAMANHSLVVDRFFVPGGVLVGDSGGCSHPLTATGMTSALHDAWLLADSVSRFGLETAALERYDRLRRPFVRTREAFSEMLYSVFRGADGGTEALRSAVFRYWQRSERARTTSMAILAGEESDALAFVSEFSRVCAISAASIVAEAARKRQPRRGLRALIDVARASEGCLTSIAPELLPRWLTGAGAAAP